MLPSTSGLSSLFRTSQLTSTGLFTGETAISSGSGNCTTLGFFCRRDRASDFALNLRRDPAPSSPVAVTRVATLDIISALAFEVIGGVLYFLRFFGDGALGKVFLLVLFVAELGNRG